MLFLSNLYKRVSLNEKVRRKRRACQIKDRRLLTALTGTYDKHREGGGANGKEVGVTGAAVVVVMVVGWTGGRGEEFGGFSVENCML